MDQHGWSRMIPLAMEARRLASFHEPAYLGVDLINQPLVPLGL
jgi:hypothetical protein